MGKLQRWFGKAFEAEAVGLVETSGRTQREISKDLGIGLSTLRRWLARHREHDLEASLPGREEDVMAELKRLRREIEIPRQEREVLKRAATFFREGGKPMRFGLIDAAKKDFPVQRLGAIRETLLVARRAGSDPPPAVRASTCGHVRRRAVKAQSPARSCALIRRMIGAALAQERVSGLGSPRPRRWRDGGMFHLALCQGVLGLRGKMRTEAGSDRLKLTIGDLNQLGNRQFVKSIAETLFDSKIILNAPPGGKRTVWTMPRGRTLLKHFKALEQIDPDESPLDVLVPLYHLRGNRRPRIPHRTKELMTRAWEEAGLDLKEPSLATVHRKLKHLVRDENAVRIRNGPLFTYPSLPVHLEGSPRQCGDGVRVDDHH